MTNNTDGKGLNNSNWKQAALVLHEQGVSWRKIAKLLGVSKSTVSDNLRKEVKGYVKPTAGDVVSKGATHTVLKGQGDVDSIEVLKLVESDKGKKKANKDVESNEDNSRILLISDLHIPYNHKDALAFLQHLKDKHKPTRVICMGDELDKHALSYHDSDPDLASAGDELRKSLPIIAELKKMFPVMDILDSNHGSLVWRKAKTHGISRHYIKSYNDVLEVDERWKWHHDLTVDLPNGQKVYLHHGKSNRVINLSQQMGMSCAQGHYHEILAVSYWGNPNGLHWALQAGCLIDDESYAFSYNNVNIKRPVIGTALIIDSLPILEPMVIKNGRWVGK